MREVYFDHQLEGDEPIVEWGFSLITKASSFRRQKAYMQSDKIRDQASWEGRRANYLPSSNDSILGSDSSNANVHSLFQLMSNPTATSSPLPNDHFPQHIAPTSNDNAVPVRRSTVPSQRPQHSSPTQPLNEMMSMLVFKQQDRKEDLKKLKGIWNEHNGRLPSRTRLRQASLATGLSQSRIRRYFLEEAAGASQPDLDQGESEFSRRLDAISKRMDEMEAAMEQSKIEMQQVEMAMCRVLQHVQQPK